MIPRIFISSTIRDLLHLRDAIRDTIVEIGYAPIMSEHDGVGWLPEISATESCYLTASECEFAVLVIGKKYNEDVDGLSVTHKEFRSLRKHRIHHITLIEKETLAFKKVYDENGGVGGLAFPGLDAPEKTFNFIKEVINSPVNNGFIGFEHTSDVRRALKNHFAHIFGNLLKSGGTEVRSDIKEILTELIQLRERVPERIENQHQIKKFSQVIRFLVDDMQNQYRLILETIFPSFEEGLEAIIAVESLDEVVKKTDRKMVVQEGFKHEGIRGAGGSCSAFELGTPHEENNMAQWAAPGNEKTLYLNRTAYIKYNNIQKQIFGAFSNSGGGLEDFNSQT